MNVRGLVMRVLRFVGGLLRAKTWHDLRERGNSRLIRTSFIWLILVPAAAKMLEPFVGEYTLKIPPLGLDDGKRVGIALPPGWVEFYFMSLCFALGQVIYHFRCPELVRQFANWGEYREAHKGNRPLIDMLAAQLEEYGQADDERLYRQIIGRLGKQPGLEQLFKDIQDPKPLPRHPTIRDLAREYIAVARMVGRGDEGALSDVFGIVLEDVNCFRRRSLFFCGWSFRVGFLLFVCTVIRNLLAVCSILVKQWGG